jgi:hypothetical protein
VVIDELQHAIGKWHRADLATLRQPEQLAVVAEQLHLAPYLDLAGVEIDVVEREPGDLALTQAKASTEIDNELVSVRQFLTHC